MVASPEVNWRALRAFRINAVREVMRERDLDALVLMGPDNIRYATDFRAWFIAEAFDWYAAVVTKEGESYLFVPFLDEDVNDPLPELPLIRQFVATPSWVSNATQAKIWVSLLRRRLESARVKTVGVEAVPPAIFVALSQEMSGAKFVPVDRELAVRRQVKHVEELRLLESSAKLASLGSTAALESLRPGKTDHEILATAIGKMLALGAEFATHYLCLHREASDWFPHGTELREGDTYAFDVGCYGIGGYGADMCRTAFVGEPSKAIRDAYKVLRQAYEEGQSGAKPGMKVSELDARINQVLIKSGYPRTPYSMGHGVGLRACELPIIYRREMMEEDADLQEGMVICLEPETRVKVGTSSIVVKLEDMFVVTRTGLRRLTDTAYADPIAGS